MSEVLYNVEDGTPPPDATPEPAPAAAEPVAEILPAAAPVEAPREPEVEVDGERMVPLSALLAERQNVKDLKVKASQLDQIASEWAQLRPYAEFVRANPDLMKPRQAEAAPVQTAPEDDPELVTLARTLDLYTAEGKPDAKRAAALATFVDKRSGNQAQEAVKPLHAQTVHQQAQVNFQNALAVDFNGVKPNPQVLQQIWRTTDPKVLATEQGAAAAVLMALGMGNLSQQQPAAAAAQAPLQTPVVTEPSGGRNVNRPAVSEFEEKAMRVRGIDLKKYGELTRSFKPGQMNPLED